MRFFNGLGRFYQGQGLYNLAEPWLEQSLSKIKAKLGNDHPDVAASLNNLALLYNNQGRYAEAEPLFLDALVICENCLGKDHPGTIDIRQNLDILKEYLSQSKY